MTAHPLDDRDPPTEIMSALEGVTTAGAPAALSLQHLHSLLTTLAPLRAAYANAAVDRLRGLPRESRRVLLPHVLHEHPELQGEPRLRALAMDAGLDVDAIAERPDLVRWLARVAGVRATSPRDVLDRVERALTVLATTIAEVAAVQHGIDADVVALDVDETLSRAVQGGPPPELAAHVDATHRATCDAIDEVLRADELASLETSVPRWWPSPFREAALWSRARVARKRLRADRTAAFEIAFASALRARLGRERA
jgi:hypothetical protein